MIKGCLDKWIDRLMLHKGWIDPTDRIDMTITYVSKNSEKMKHLLLNLMKLGLSWKTTNTE